MAPAQDTSTSTPFGRSSAHSPSPSTRLNALDAAYLAAVGRAEPRGDGLEPILAAREEHELRPAAGEGLGERLAEPFGGPGHDRPPPVGHRTSISVIMPPSAWGRTWQWVIHSP